jgi:hypothetical protein
MPEIPDATLVTPGSAVPVALTSGHVDAWDI